MLTPALMFAPAAGFCEEQPDGKPTEISMADGKVSLTAPKQWVRKKPRNRIIAHEFAAPAVEGDENDGRLTLMQAGGSIDANINRWIAQFKQPDGKPTRERAKIEKKEIAGQQVHVVDISGTFADRRGPFAPAVQRERYRMLAAIIVTEDLGQHFVKLYGPRKTIAANEKAFQAFLSSLKVED